MSDDRREALVKAAGDCIDLMNLGVEPTAALKKVAADNSMNDNEVVLVSHAVNNAKVLSHIQETKGDDRSKPFPLTDAELVTGKPLDGDIETESESAKSRKDQPDATEITKKIASAAVPEFTQKLAQAACMQSYVSEGSYRGFTKEAVDLRAAWGLPTDTATPELADEAPYAALSQVKMAIDQATNEAGYHREMACAGVDQLAEVFSKVAHPDYNQFEEAARRAGVSQDALDTIYEFGALEDIGITRSQVKVAGERMYVSREIADLVKIASSIDEHIDEAANRLAAKNILDELHREQEVKLAALPKAVFDVGGMLDSAESASERAGMLGEDVIKGLGLSGESTGADIMNLRGGMKGEGPEIPKIDINVRQKLTNADARGKVEELLADEYIGKHNPIDVVDAYNLAMSVNPKFGRAELISYVRQHLANRGAMPLDLLLKARKSQQPGAMNEEGV